MMIVHLYSNGTVGALGTRNYAAPEILSGIRNFATALSESFHRQRPNNKTIGACVSNYGMIADAFSVGATIRHMLTGVPPAVDVEEFIASKNHPLKKLLKRVKKGIKKNNN